MSSNLPSKTARNYQPQIQGILGITKSGFDIPPHIFRSHHVWLSEGAEADDHFHWRIQGETPGEMRIHGSVVTLVVKRWGISSNPPRFQSAHLWRFSKCQGGDVGNLLEKSALEFLGDFLVVIWKKRFSGCSKTKMESSWWGEVLMSIPLADVKVVYFKTTVFSLCLICFFVL